jgi:hypothetical protein
MMMHPDDRQAARQRANALAAYKHLLEYIALLDCLNPEASKAQLIRAAQFMLNEYPCDIRTLDDDD